MSSSTQDLHEQAAVQQETSMVQTTAADSPGLRLRDSVLDQPNAFPEHLPLAAQQQLLDFHMLPNQGVLQRQPFPDGCGSEALAECANTPLLRAPLYPSSEASRDDS